MNDVQPRILGFEEEVEEKSFAEFEDGIYAFTYAGFTQGNHAPDQYDQMSYPTAIAKLQLVNEYTCEQGEKNEVFKMVDKPYNVKKIARFFSSMGCPKGPNGKIKMAWNSAIGRTGHLELTTKEMKDKNADGTPKTWQNVNFLLPEEVQDKIEKWSHKLAQKAPVQPTQPAQPATQTWRGGNW